VRAAIAAMAAVIATAVVVGVRKLVRAARSP
jgi:hypothetical protein